MLFGQCLTSKQLYDSVFIDIAAGSTGMPDTNEERMRWIELMPIIMQNIELVQQMRSFGVPDEFNPYVQLLEETFKRFDERIDISKFFTTYAGRNAEGYAAESNDATSHGIQGGQQTQTNLVWAVTATTTGFK